MEAARRPLRSVLDHSSRWSVQDLVQKTILPKLALFTQTEQETCKPRAMHYQGTHQYNCTYAACRPILLFAVVDQDLPMPHCNARCPQGQAEAR